MTNLILTLQFLLSAYEIIRLKGYTSWAIGLCCANLCEALLSDRNVVIPVTTNVSVNSSHFTTWFLTEYFIHFSEDFYTLNVFYSEAYNSSESLYAEKVKNCFWKMEVGSLELVLWELNAFLLLLRDTLVQLVLKIKRNKDFTKILWTELGTLCGSEAKV